ncbi:sulfur carrier protein ThiS [Halomonas garicola]|uniref:sulfur carrier protein ThiS n=1 Tax=Halomonas garicola TaxID=1690008 RepID=UPI0028A19442|nr:sulfur carrier protein ThiS [Halomonas garicola]
MTEYAIQLNGEPHSLAPRTSAADLIEQLGLGGRRIAVEINEEIVPRSQLAETHLANGDKVEIVHAIGGG